MLLNGAMAVMAMQAIVPLGSLVLLTGSWNSLIDSLSGARGEIGYSLTVALQAALFCLPLGYAVARSTLLDGRRWGWYGMVAVNCLIVILSLVGYSHSLNFLFLAVSAGCLALLFSPRIKAESL